jgi:hypothetical protein
MKQDYIDLYKLKGGGGIIDQIYSLFSMISTSIGGLIGIDNCNIETIIPRIENSDNIESIEKILKDCNYTEKEPNTGGVHNVKIYYNNNTNDKLVLKTTSNVDNFENNKKLLETSSKLEITPKLYLYKKINQDSIITIHKAYDLDLFTFYNSEYIGTKIIDINKYFPENQITNQDDIDKNISKQYIYLIQKMLDNNLLCLDIKPQNCVINYDVVKGTAVIPNDTIIFETYTIPINSIDVRIIDMDYDTGSGCTLKEEKEEINKNAMKYLIIIFMANYFYYYLNNNIFSKYFNDNKKEIDKNNNILDLFNTDKYNFSFKRYIRSKLPPVTTIKNNDFEILYNNCFKKKEEGKS